MPKRIDWTLWDSLLGAMHDADLAAKIGCSWMSVYKRRQHLGIAAHKARVDWGQYDAQLGAVPDHILAKRIGCTQACVFDRRTSRGIPPYRPQASYVDWSRWDHKLGTMSDKALAKLIGCGHVAVFNRRRLLGILPYRRWPNGVAHSRRTSLLQGLEALLGTMPDAALARMVGLSRQRVSALRASRNIPRYIFQPTGVH